MSDPSPEVHSNPPYPPQGGEQQPPPPQGPPYPGYEYYQPMHHYPVQPMMYPMPPFPPMPPPPQIPQQQMSQLTVDDKSGEKDTDSKDDGKNKSWAGLLKTKGEGEELQQSQNGEHSEENNAMQKNAGRQWTHFVKESARRFAEAQQLYMWAGYNGMNPFVVIGGHYQVPQEVMNMVLQGETLPPAYEHIDLLAKHMRTICSLNFLSLVNMEVPLNPSKAYFVIQCENEMEVFQYIKRSAWQVDNAETEQLLEHVVGTLGGVVSIYFFFTIPTLNKLVGVAEALSSVLKLPDSDGKFIQLRWMYIRDIPMTCLKPVNYLKNPQYRRQRDRDESKAEDSNAAEDSQEQEQQSQEENNEDASKSEDVGDRSEDVAGSSNSSSLVQKKGYDGPRVYQIDDPFGDVAIEIVKRFVHNGGILLDYGEYAAAEQQGRPPNPQNLICGGPRAKSSTSSHRGRGRGMGTRFGSSRGSRGGSRSGRGGSFSQQHSGGHQMQQHRSSGVESRSRGSSRGRGVRRGQGSGMEDRRETSQRSEGSNQRGRASRGKPQTRKVEGSDGATTLRGQYTFEIQHKKSKPRKASSSAPAEPSTKDE